MHVYDISHKFILDELSNRYEIHTSYTTEESSLHNDIRL